MIEKKGITLISLVVTIVVLLILAGISISLILGNNGIIKKSTDGKEKTIVESEKEAITLALNACKIGENPTRVISATELKQELTNQGKDVEVTSSGTTLTVTYKNNGHNYKVEQDGKITSSDEQTVSMADFGTYETVLDITDGDNNESYMPDQGDAHPYVLDSNGMFRAYSYSFKNDFSRCNWTTLEKSNSMNVQASRLIIEKGFNNVVGCIDTNNKLNLFKSDHIVTATNAESTDNKLKYFMGQYALVGNSDLYSPNRHEDNTFTLEKIDNSFYSAYLPFYANIKNASIEGSNEQILCEDGKVYVYGSQFSSLAKDGNSYAFTCLNDVENSAINGKKITNVYYKKDTTIALDDNGKVYTWGNNENGQLGVNNTDNNLVPVCISDINGNALKNKKIIDISNQRDSIYALDNEGKVYAWGNNENGQLGNGTNTNSNVPICISDLDNAIKGKIITKIVPNNKCVATLDSNGNVYTWGANNFGCLGIGHQNEDELYSINTPNCISNIDSSAIKNVKITDIKEIVYDNLGNGYIVTDESGNIYIWGKYNEVEYKDYNSPICLTTNEESNLKNIKAKSIKIVKNNYIMLLTDNDDLIVYYAKYGMPS